MHSILSQSAQECFVDNFPNRQQLWTSDDGLWVAINIPVGDWIIEMWIYDEDLKSHLLWCLLRGCSFRNQ